MHGRAVSLTAAWALSFFMMAGAQASVPLETPAAKSRFSYLDRDALLQAYQAEVKKESMDFCNRLAPLLAEMQARGGYSGPIQSLQADADMWCAVDEKRWKDAYGHLLRVESFDGEGSKGYVGFLIAWYADEDPGAVQRLIALAALQEPDELLKVESREYRILSDSFKQKDNLALRNQLFEALYASKHFPGIAWNVREAVATVLFENDVTAGRFQRAEALLSWVLSPNLYIQYLGDRRYSGVWPLLEKAAGPNLSIVGSKYIGLVGEAYRKDSGNTTAMKDYAQALYEVGLFEQAVSLVDLKGMDALDEDKAWALNVKANSLDILGRPAESEAVFNALVAVPYDKNRNGWLVSFAINRSLSLVEKGQWQKGYDASLLADKITAQSGSEFAEILVLYAKSCSLYQMGQKAKARPLLEQVYLKRKVSYETAAYAMLCANDTERAEQILLEGLADDKEKSELSKVLQQNAFHSYVVNTKMPTLYQALRHRPKVDEAFQRIARDIPESMIPEAEFRRAELKKAMGVSGKP